jgi:guanylate kinase
LIVISGPSGVGKDAVLDVMRESIEGLYFAVTATTRPKREGETEGVDYRFVSEAQFQQMIDGGELLEWANVYGNRYGVPKGGLREALRMGQDAVVKVDVQGAKTIKAAYPEAVLIFIAAPSLRDLEERLKRRETESEVDIKVRIDAVREEMESLTVFDYVVLNRNDRVASVVSSIQAIILAEKCRVQPRRVEL